MIQVRSATSEDDHSIETLLDLARALLLRQRGGAALLATPPRSDDERLVAVVDGAVVGLASLRIDGDRAMLSTLFVHPEMRGVGVGHSLLDTVVARARSRGAKHLDSLALPGDRETKNFFESHAMKSRLLVVHQEL